GQERARERGGVVVEAGEQPGPRRGQRCAVVVVPAGRRIRQPGEEPGPEAAAPRRGQRVAVAPGRELDARRRPDPHHLALADLEQREPLGPEPDPAAVRSEPLARLEQLPARLERRRVPTPARRANDPEPAALRVERDPVTGAQRLRVERPELLRAVEATGQHEVRSSASSAPSAAPAHAEPARGSHRAAEFLLTRRRGERGVVAGPGCVRGDSEPSSPGSTSMLHVVSSGGIEAQPTALPAGRGRLHPANADWPGTNHHIKGSLNTPRSLRSARDPESTLRASDPPRSPRLRVSQNSAPSASAGAAEGAEKPAGPQRKPAPTSPGPKDHQGWD